MVSFNPDNQSDSIFISGWWKLYKTFWSYLAEKQSMFSDTIIQDVLVRS